MTRLSLDRDEVDVAQLIFPRLALTHASFDALHGEIRERAAQQTSGDPVFVSASFHPDYPLDQRSPAQLVPFLRRTPDPTLQLLNFATLNQVRSGDEARGTAFVDLATVSIEDLAAPARASVTERIARSNFTTLEQVGQERLGAIYADIRADRERAYARFRD